MKAAIFDMDGLLIDSEPLWQEAEITVFKSVGVMLSREHCRETMGLRLDEVVSHWYGRFPWRGASLEAVEEKILALVGRLIIERGKPMPGVKEVVDLLRAANYELAVASSSPMGLIVASLEKFGLIEYFSVLHSAEAAGAQVIAVHDAANAHDSGFAKADVVLSSLTDFSLELVR
jgi:sugar-phosphatase